MKEALVDTWWSRNWKWCLPMGCLSSIALCIGVFAGLMFILSFSITRSDVYKQALARAEGNPEIAEILGTPIEGGLMTSCSVKDSGDSGEADLVVPISGPKGQGELLVSARKVSGSWVYTRLIAKLDQTEQVVVLVDEEE